MNKQREFFIKNPRLRMLINTFDKMPNEKQKMHLDRSAKYISKIKQ